MNYKDNAPVRFQTSTYTRYDAGLCFDRGEFMGVWGQPVNIGDITSYQVELVNAYPQLLSNPDFDDASAWTFGGDWAHSAGTAVYTFASGGTLSQGIVIRAGLIILLGFQISSISGFTGGETMDVSIGGTTVYTIDSTDVVGAIFLQHYVSDMTNNELRFTSSDDVSIAITSTILTWRDTPNVAIKDVNGDYTRTNNATITAPNETTVLLADLKNVGQVDLTWPTIALGTYQLSSFNTAVDANLGTEKIAEPQFSSSTGWGLGANWAIALNTATFSGPGGGGSSELKTSNSIGLSAFATYLVQVTFSTAPTGTGNVVIDLEGIIADTIDVTTITAGQQFSYLTTIGAIVTSDFTITADNTVTNLDITLASVIAIIGDDATEDLSTEPYQLETTWVCSQLLAWTDANNVLDHNFEQFSFTHKMRVIGKFETPTYVEDENKQLLDSNSRWQSTFVSSYKEVPFKLFPGAPLLGAPDYIYSALNDGFHHGNFAIDGVNHQKLAENLELNKPDPLMKLYTAEVRLQETSAAGATINPDGTLVTSNVTSAYSTMIDNSGGVATASGGDTFKFRSANAALTVLIANNDVTHGDNLLLTLVQSAIDTIYNTSSTFTASRTATLSSTDTLTFENSSTRTTPMVILNQSSTGDAGIRLAIAAVWFQWYIDNSDGDKLKLEDSIDGVQMAFDTTNGTLVITPTTTFENPIITESDVSVDLNSVFRLPANATIAQVNAIGEMAFQTTVTDWADGLLSIHNGTVLLRVVSMTDTQFTSPTDGYIIAYNATNDEFELVDPDTAGVDTLYTASGTLAASTVITESTTDTLTIQNASTRASALLILDQTSTGDAGIEFKVAAQSYYIGIDNSADDVLVLGRGSAIGTTPDVFFDSSGQVGIGKAPDTILQAYDNSTSTTPMVKIEQDGTGDSALHWFLTGAAGWTQGIDNSDSDNFKLSRHSSLGTNDAMVFDASGDSTFPGTMGIQDVVTISVSDTSTAGTLNIDQASTGDAGIKLSVAAQSHYIGIDNSDSDKLKIGLGAAIGTTPTMTFDTSANVGIGTTTPGTLLEISKNMGSDQFRIRRTGSSLGFADLSVNSLGLTIEADGSTQDYILLNPANGGNVGIFEGAPDERLHVVGNVKVEGQIYSDIAATLTPAGTTETIDWDDGNFAVLDLESASGNVTLTLSNPNAGASYIIEIRQDSTVPLDVVWPGAVLWPGGTAPVISVGADAVDEIRLDYNGTSYLGRFDQNYS